MNQDNNLNETILNQGTQRNQGKTAQRMNILAAKLIGETVRTTLGPQGMDKMIVNSLGDVIITNDGATILKEMNIEHPTANMIVEIAKTQENEVGDGTTTAVVLAGELLKKAEELIDQKIHPTTVIKGYRIAAKKSLLILKNMSERITHKDKDVLRKLSMTAMTGKVAEDSKEHLSNIVVEALDVVAVDETVNLEDVKIEKKIGGSISETELIKGVVLDRGKVHNNMPSKITNAKIALIDTPLEVRTPETDARISVSDPQKLQAFLDMEDKMLKKMVDDLVSSGANVVFCQKGIDESIQYLLAQKGIYACRRVKKSDLHQLAKATGGVVVSNLKDLKKKQLGFAGLVEELVVNDDSMTFIKQCKNPKAVTILVRASTEHIADEVVRAIEDSLGNVASALREELVVGGAGATEIELSRNLSLYSQKLSGKEQLAVMAFAKAMEIIPKTLSENAGLDPIDIIAELKSLHDKGKKWAGVNVYEGAYLDSFKEGIIEPLLVKSQAIKSASDVAIMILRIDDIIIAGINKNESAKPDFDSY